MAVNSAKISVVAPLVGAWIEITLEDLVETQEMVAPLVGAWIEIVVYRIRLGNDECRSSRGSVD